MVINRTFDHPVAGVAGAALVVGLRCGALAVDWNRPSVGWLGAATAMAGSAGRLLAAMGVSAAVIAYLAEIGAGTMLLKGSLRTVRNNP